MKNLIKINSIIDMIIIVDVMAMNIAVVADKKDKTLSLY